MHFPRPHLHSDPIRLRQALAPPAARLPTLSQRGCFFLKTRWEGDGEQPDTLRRCIFRKWDLRLDEYLRSFLYYPHPQHLRRSIHLPRPCSLCMPGDVGAPAKVCVFISAVPITKLFAWGKGDSGGHVLRETTSRGLGGLVCPSRTSERGREGDCVERRRGRRRGAREGGRDP